MSKKQSMTYTMADIARIANTSIMTVSRVLNNKPDVSKETRQRVLEIIEKFGYKPHSFARKLSGGKTNIVGVALYADAYPLAGFYLNVLHGLQAGLAEQEYDVLLLAPRRDKDSDDTLLRYNLLDGIVLMGPHTSAQDIITIADSNIPFLTIGKRMAGAYIAPYVAPNYAGVFRLAIDYAANEGCTEITVMVSGLGRDDSSYVKERIHGVESAIQAHGDTIRVQSLSSSGSFQDGYEAFHNIPEMPDMTVIDTTEFSFGAVMALRDRGLLSKEQHNIIGISINDSLMQRFEDLLGFRILHWTIPWEKVGARAAHELITQMNAVDVDPPLKPVYAHLDFERREAQA